MMLCRWGMNSQETSVLADLVYCSKWCLAKVSPHNVSLS